MMADHSLYLSGFAVDGNDIILVLVKILLRIITKWHHKVKGRRVVVVKAILGNPFTLELRVVVPTDQHKLL